MALILKNTERNKKIMEILEGLTIEEGEGILYGCLLEISEIEAEATKEIRIGGSDKPPKEIKETRETSETTKNIEESLERTRGNLETARRYNRIAMALSLLAVVIAVARIIIGVLT